MKRLALVCAVLLAPCAGYKIDPSATFSLADLKGASEQELTVKKTYKFF